MKKNEISVSEWLAAEREASRGITEQPKGSVTTDQYGEMTNRSGARACQILRDMFKAGKVTREKWRGPESTVYVYFLK